MNAFFIAILCSKGMLLALNGESSLQQPNSAITTRKAIGQIFAIGFLSGLCCFVGSELLLTLFSQ
ncbi:hypothetical protein [Synechococcus sp. PCC 7336]|uniref:hypothetical protein n=1 Tax=Synechococcus sp. PCC 7336 TaxID=195250 RepID=UPI000346F5CE|nr:hypothetical protein [Synechococcus sp. PCC 7336]